MISVLTSYCLLLSFVSFPILLSVKVFPLVLLTNIFPITFGNLGTREGATIFLLGRCGVNSEIGLSIGLSLFFLHTVIPSLVGLLLIQTNSKNMGNSQRSI